LARRKPSHDAPSKPATKGGSQPVQPAEREDRGHRDWLLAGVTALYALTLLVAGAHPRSLLWSFDLFAYLPPGQHLGLTLLLAAGLALIMTALVGGRRDRSHGRVHAPPVWLAVLLIPLAGILWLLRDRVHLLGDGLTWIEIAKTGSRPLYSEPLAAAVISEVASISNAQIATALATLSVGCGLIAAVLYYCIAKEISPPGAPRAIAMGLFLTLGCNQLYFGYIESYPIASVAVLLYLWVMLRCLDGRLPLTLAALALAVAISSHFVAFVLIPSYVFLVIRSRVSRARSAILLASPPILLAGTLVALHYPLPTILEPIRFITGGGGPATASMTGLSKAMRRVPHFLNLCFLVTPIPLLLALARLPRLRSERDEGDPKMMALLTAAVPGLIAAIALSLFVFPGHDWDLITMALLPGIVLAVKVGAEYLARAPRPVAAGLIGLGAASLLAFVLVNANESSAIQRYDALLAADIPLSAHERAYGNERLVKVYTQRRDPEAALTYALRAVESDPANDRYWGNVGSLLYNLKRYPEATHYYEEAARRGSTRPEVYYYLAQSLVRQDRWQEAARAAQRTVELGGEHLNYLFTLGLTRAGAGDLDGARRVWDHVIQRWPEDKRTRQAYEYYLGHPSPEIAR
jgi:cytochrome c-type biogenesis protein CcmH/NrfG